MNKLKSNDEAPDRLSELPDSLIFLIMSFMEMRDVVKTTLLSKRWKDLWMTTPYLYFDENRSFINRALRLWRGSNILKFKINFSEKPYCKLSSWLSFATRNNVQELDLKFSPSGVGIVIQSLHSCSSIQKLSLINCNLVVRGAVQWRRLKCLTLCVSFVSQDSINQVFYGSPQLENFELEVQKHGCLSIQSSSLKILSLRSHVHDPSNAARLEIWGPKLETLVIQGAPHSRCFLMNVPSLSRVNLDFTFINGEEVELSPGGFEMRLMEGVLNAKVLRVRGASCEVILDLLKLFPKLEMLAIDLKESPAPELSEADIPIDFLMQLTTVEITWYECGAWMFKFVEFLVKHATMLAKIVSTKVVRSEDASSPPPAAENLPTLQTSFHTLSFNILYKKRPTPHCVFALFSCLNKFVN